MFFSKLTFWTYCTFEFLWRYKHLWNVLEILLSGEMVSLEKHVVFLDCHRLASFSRTSSCKTLLQCIIWQFSVQFSVNGELETTSLKMSLTVGLVLDMSIARSPVSYHIKILVCLWNIGTMRGRSNEVVEVMSRIWHLCFARGENERCIC